MLEQILDSSLPSDIKFANGWAIGLKPYSYKEHMKYDIPVVMSA